MLLRGILFTAFLFMLLIDACKAKSINTDDCNMVREHYFHDLKHHLRSAKFTTLLREMEAFVDRREASKSSIMIVKYMNHELLWNNIKLKEIPSKENGNLTIFNELINTIIHNIALLVKEDGIMPSLIIDEVLHGPAHNASDLLLFRKWFHRMVSILKALISFKNPRTCIPSAAREVFEDIEMKKQNVICGKQQPSRPIWKKFEQNIALAPVEAVLKLIDDLLSH